MARITVDDCNNPNSLSHNTITAFHVSLTEPGVLWTGTPAGLNRFDAKTGRFTQYRHEPGNANSLSYDGILSICEAPAEPGIVWIGTGANDGSMKGGGLNRFDTQSGAFTHYRHNPGDPNSISSDIITALHADEHGALWVGTSAGLDKFDRETGTFTHFVPNPGNPTVLSHTVASIFADSKGYLWIRTPLAISLQSMMYRSLLRKVLSMRLFDRRDQVYLVAYVLKPLYEIRNQAFRVEIVEVVFAQILVSRMGFKHMINDYEKRMSNSNQSAFFPSSPRQARY